MQLRAGPSSSEGEHVRAYDSQAAKVPPRDNMCVRPADLIANYQIQGGGGGCAILVQATTMAVSQPGDIIGAEGG